MKFRVLAVNTQTPKILLPLVAKVAHVTDAVCQCIIVCDDRAALNRMKLFGRVKAEH